MSFVVEKVVALESGTIVGIGIGVDDEGTAVMVVFLSSTIVSITFVEWRTRHGLVAISVTTTLLTS